ncbi:MAG: prolyl oligopeptidase family serine peptidase [Myxococcota bacterium]
MKRTTVLPLLLLLGCNDATGYVHDRVACGSLGGGSGGEDSDGSSDESGLASDTDPSGSTTDDEIDPTEGSSTGEPPGSAIPTPTAPCPTITDGVVTFCPGPLDTCREALVLNASNATGSGPLSLHWHGTFESPDGILAGDYAAQQIQTMIQNEGGLMVLPYGDPGAVARPNIPFPWWVVCGALGTECDRLDDFIFADEIVACAVEQDLVDPQRLTTSGMSAGGIMTSHLVDRTSYFAGAVSWSGGTPAWAQPATPTNETAVMVLHGGPTDLYCGEGTESCYDFVQPSESLAAEVAAAGNFSFLCDHQSGHNTGMGNFGATFIAQSHADGHPWENYSFGNGGNWMLDNYCYLPGEPSPWQ